MAEKRRVVKLKEMQLFELGESKSKTVDKPGVRFYIVAQNIPNNETNVRDLQYDRQLTLPSSANVYAHEPPKFYNEKTGETADVKPEGTPKSPKKGEGKPKERITPKKEEKKPPIKEDKVEEKTEGEKVAESKAPPPAKKGEKDPYDKTTMTKKQLDKWSANAEKQEKIIVSLKREIDIKFLAMGISLINFDNKKYWDARGYNSMRSWLGSPEINISKSKANRGMDIAKTLMLGHNYTTDDLKGVGEAKLAMITNIVDDKTEKKDIDNWLGNARVLSKSDLKKEIDKFLGKPVREVSQTYKGNLIIRGEEIFLINKEEKQDINLLQLCKSYGTDEITATIKIMSKPE